MLDRSIYPDCHSAAESASRKSSASSAELWGPQQLTLAQLLWPRTTSIAPRARQPQQHTSSNRHVAVGNEVMMFHNTWRNGEGVNTSCLLHLILNNPFWQGDNFVSILNRFIKWEITSLQGGNNVSTFSKVFCMCSIVKRGSHVWSPAPALLHHYETANSSWWRGASAWQLAAAVHDTAWPGPAQQLVTSHDSSQHTSSEGRHYLTIYWLAVPWFPAGSQTRWVCGDYVASLHHTTNWLAASENELHIHCRNHNVYM